MDFAARAGKGGGSTLRIAGGEIKGWGSHRRMGSTPASRLVERLSSLPPAGPGLLERRERLGVGTLEAGMPACESSLCHTDAVPTQLIDSGRTRSAWRIAQRTVSRGRQGATKGTYPCPPPPPSSPVPSTKMPCGLHAHAPSGSKRGKCRGICTRYVCGRLGRRQCANGTLAAQAFQARCRRTAHMLSGPWAPRSSGGKFADEVAR